MISLHYQHALKVNNYNLKEIFPIQKHDKSISILTIKVREIHLFHIINPHKVNTTVGKK